MKKRLPILLFIFFFISKIPAQELHHVLGEILVQINPKADIKDIARQLNYFKNKPTKIKIKKELSAPMHIWLLEFDYANINENHFLNKIINLNDVRNAQLNRLVKMRQNIPNDPNFDLQWMWLNTGQNGGLPDADIDADLAWDITTGGQTMDGHEIVVCIIEGCNRDHPDLQGNLWFNEQEIPGNNMDDDGNGYVDDYNGWNITSNNDFINSENHGTITSGMVGAKGNNGLLITGINWDVKIMHVDYNSFSEADAVEAYTYPLIMRRLYNQTGGEQGAFVVATNLSAGIDGGDPADSPLWCAIYDTLGTAGILNCAATTNDDVNVDIVGDIPTACSSEYLIAVTSTDDNDMRTSGGYGI
ncbi:MAG TPA: peptidase, partial [Bacteroidetes bacterium]|nr:peptidase [Bacteroidota bacterium]